MAEPEKKPVSINEVDPRTRAQVKKELHQKNEEERKRAAEQLKADYASIADSPALADILAKARQFADWHLKLAKDGVGSKNVGVDPETNQPQFEDYYLTSEQRIAELDKASGQEQLIAYIEGKLK